MGGAAQGRLLAETSSTFFEAPGALPGADDSPLVLLVHERLHRVAVVALDQGLELRPALLALPHRDNVDAMGLPGTEWMMKKVALDATNRATSA